MPWRPVTTNADSSIIEINARLTTLTTAIFTEIRRQAIIVDTRFTSISNNNAANRARIVALEAAE